ncbi:MAG: FecR domain-containing protein [Methylotenera sp.]|nr:FecR domain-containing protein [Methylotenera sp.]
MENQNYIYLNRKAVMAAMITAAFPMGVNAAAGKVEFASGGATIQNADGISKVMSKGMEINQGDTILTGAGRAQVKFSDGGYISFQPNTQFKIEEYNYNGKQDGTERGFFRLVEGGLRALTGLVGRESRPNYRMATPVATIGIRGSYYLAEFREKLTTHVGHGSIYVFNEQGDIILFEGQGATVESGKAPGYTDEGMTLGARGPDGAQPNDTKDEQQANNENHDVFRVSEQYGDDGIACLSGDCAGMGATIANLNGIGAEGHYQLDNTQKNVGGGEGWSSKVSSANIYANFGTYSISSYSNISIDSEKTVSGSTYTASNSFNLSGSILANGVFGVTGSSSYGVCSGYSACTINAIGFFSGSQAEKATVGYVIKGVDNGFGGTGVITGTAGLVANPPPAKPSSL